MRNTAFVAVGLLFLIVQANLFRLLLTLHRLVDWLADTCALWLGVRFGSALKSVGHLVGTPNLILPLLVFIGVHEYSMARGAALAFVLGYALDLFAAAPVGLFTFVSVLTFVLARAAGVRLTAQTVLTQLGLAFVFAVAYGLMVLILLAIFGKNPYGPRALSGVLLPHAVSTAIVAPFVFRVAQRLHSWTTPVPRPGEGSGA